MKIVPNIYTRIKFKKHDILKLMHIYTIKQEPVHFVMKQKAIPYCEFVRGSDGQN